MQWNCWGNLLSLIKHYELLIGEKKVKACFHCDLKLCHVKWFYQYLWCIFKFDQLDLACKFKSSKLFRVYYISHEYQYLKTHKMGISRFCIIKFVLFTVLQNRSIISHKYQRNLPQNIYQMIENRVCDSSRETWLGKIPQHRKREQAGG